MRKQNSVAVGGGASPAPADVLPKKGKRTAEKKKAEPKKEQTVKEPGIMHIIEEKPHRRVVIEYLQKRANELSVQKMS